MSVGSVFCYTFFRGHQIGKFRVILSCGCLHPRVQPSNPGTGRSTLVRDWLFCELLGRLHAAQQLQDDGPHMTAACTQWPTARHFTTAAPNAAGRSRFAKVCVQSSREARGETDMNHLAKCTTMSISFAVPSATCDSTFVCDTAEHLEVALLCFSS